MFWMELFSKKEKYSILEKIVILRRLALLDGFVKNPLVRVKRRRLAGCLICLSA
jgi:hypothetical protein